GQGGPRCIGNSGPRASAGIGAVVKEKDLSVVAVLSGNRNFEGRIHPLVRASYLASPPLVVAYALAGTVDIDLTEDPLGADRDGNAVHLKDLWPAPEEVAAVVRESVRKDMFDREYARIFEGDEY